LNRNFKFTSKPPMTRSPLILNFFSLAATLSSPNFSGVPLPKWGKTLIYAL